MAPAHGRQLTYENYLRQSVWQTIRHWFGGRAGRVSASQVRQQITTTRSLVVEEFEDEGPHCFLELGDGSVLYLQGQSLHDYGFNCTTDDRGFPSSEFTLVCDADEGFVVGIECTGTPLVPLAHFPAFEDSGYRLRHPLPSTGVEYLPGVAACISWAATLKCWLTRRQVVALSQADAAFLSMM